MDTIDILCTLRFAGDLLDALRAVSPRFRVTQSTAHNPGEVAAALQAQPDAEILYTFHLPPNALDLAPRLRWVQLHSAGADHLLDHPIMSSDVLVTTTSGIHATPIAEYVLASILAYRWQVPLWTRCQREGRWPSDRWNLFARPELRGSTLGVVGYGSIGREVGRLAKAFGMRVLAARRSTGRADQGYAVDGTGDPDGTIPERFYAPGALQAMLAECDYVVVALPLTAATRHTIGEPELRAMKPSAYLVNIARGGLIDEAALVRALREGWIGGAGLDVFETEPLPPDSPLWELDNALISPHVAGFTPHYDKRAVTLFAGNLSRYLAGLPLQNQVDKKKGY
ncbi:MAG: D-2-hydroxyacid dehydrogenase [Anaerolineae bacterium]|nr:D-2-hydroxyacid dehydrogenase [Anaerolineae bacterium]